MLLDPDRYGEAPAYDLLVAAARGQAGLDHRFLHAILDRSDMPVADLVRFGLEERDDPVPLEEDLVAIFRCHPTPEAIPFLIESVRREPLNISDNLLEAFCRLGEAAAEPLLALYRELGEEEGAEVAFLLAALEVRAPAILEVLLERLRFDTEEAAFNLGLYGDPAAQPALEEALRRAEAEEAPSQWAVQALREALVRLEHPDPAVVVEPYDIWGDYPERELPRFDILSARDRLQFLESPAAEYRAGAAESFGSELTPAAKPKLFELAQNDPEPKVRAACWQVLGEAREDQAIRDAMLTRLEDPKAPLVERCGALVGSAGDPAVRRWIIEFYNLPRARAKALETMWLSGDRRFIEYLGLHLEDPDLETRRQAVLGVGYLEAGTHAGRLYKLFTDEELRLEALFAYALSVPGAVSRIRMRQLFNRIDEMAGGLSATEAEVVESALNQRLRLKGLAPLTIMGSGEKGEYPPD